jgi:hypothetical protein
VQSLDIAFPGPLGVDRISGLVEPRIEAGWVKDAAKKARDAAGKDKEARDSRMPVAITTRFVSEGETHTDAAIYDVGYRREGSLLGGSEVDLLGLSLVERVAAKDAQARLDALWRERTQ